MFREMILQTEVNVELKKCSDLSNFIKDKLVKLEGQCISNGFIKKGSIEIISRSLGETTIYNNTSSIYYHVTFKALICNPQINEEIECKMEKKNKMGILASAYSKNEKLPFRVIIARQHHESELWKDKIDSMNTVTTFNASVIGSRFNIQDKMISVIAKFE
tara:strand:+ start:72 stop:554 length:483 start_codon:yes stop_codon:yes gene_type:complete